MELMVTLALAAAVMTVGVPAFRNFAANGRLTGAANETLVALVSARNEAIRRQQRTSFCGTASPDSTLAACSDTATAGFISFVDLNDNCVREANEDIVATVVLHTQIKMKRNLKCIGYAPSGFRTIEASEPTNARAVFCDNRGNAKVAEGSILSVARGLEIVSTGRAAVTRLHADLNTWEGGTTPVKCP